MLRLTCLSHLTDFSLIVCSRLINIPNFNKEFFQYIVKYLPNFSLSFHNIFPIFLSKSITFSLVSLERTHNLANFSGELSINFSWIFHSFSQNLLSTLKFHLQKLFKIFWYFPVKIFLKFSREFIQSFDISIYILRKIKLFRIFHLSSQNFFRIFWIFLHI